MRQMFICCQIRQVQMFDLRQGKTTYLGGSMGALQISVVTKLFKMHGKWTWLDA